MSFSNFDHIRSRPAHGQDTAIESGQAVRWRSAVKSAASGEICEPRLRLSGNAVSFRSAGQSAASGMGASLTGMKWYGGALRAPTQEPSTHEKDFPLRLHMEEQGKTCVLPTKALNYGQERERNLLNDFPLVRVAQSERPFRGGTSQGEDEE